MKSLKRIYLKFLLWATPAPARLGWTVSCLGDSLNETAGQIGMNAWRELGELGGGK